MHVVSHSDSAPYLGYARDLMSAALPVRLSKSALWSLQKEAYFQFGIESWTKKGVPFHVTNNSLIARQYAEIALPFFKMGPVTFLEIGAGSGKFAYLFLSELFALGVPESSVQYLLTDFAEKNVIFCQNHPLFIPWIEKGIVFPVVYDPLTSQTLPFSPNFVIANYFFDAIPQDLFRKQNGEIFEGLVSICVEEGGDLANPHSISKLSLDYCYQPIDLKGRSYFDSPELEKVFMLYQDQVQNGIFLFPSGGINVLCNLEKICRNPFVLLTADWRSVLEEPRLINLHGTFSFPVNFQALAPFFVQKEGEAFINNQGSSRFYVALFSNGKIPETSSRIFKSQYFSPLQKSDLYLKPDISLKELLDYVVEANWDATLFFSYLESFEKLFERATEEEKSLLLEGCLKIQARFYPLFREEARLLDRLGLFLEGRNWKKEAKALFDAARQFFVIHFESQQESDFTVLQIGRSHLPLLFSGKTLTLVPLNLSALQSVGVFDLILFFPQQREKLEEPKVGLIQQIEKQFPSLKQLVYTDADLHEFLAKIDTLAALTQNLAVGLRESGQYSYSKCLIEFFSKLERDGQISSFQLEMVFDHLEKQGIIHSTDRITPSTYQEGVDYFEILLCALKYHMKKGGVLKALFPLFFEDDRFFNEITVNPYLDCKEEVYETSAGEKLLCIVIRWLI